MITSESWRTRSDNMRLRDYRHRTQGAYELATRLFLDWAKTEPESLTEAHVRGYFLCATCSGPPVTRAPDGGGHLVSVAPGKRDSCSRWQRTFHAALRASARCHPASEIPRAVSQQLQRRNERRRQQPKQVYG
jgi:hypothetical protein